MSSSTMLSSLQAVPVPCISSTAKPTPSRGMRRHRHRRPAAPRVSSNATPNSPRDTPRRRPRQSINKTTRTGAAAAPSSTEQQQDVHFDVSDVTIEEYNKLMAEKMGWHMKNPFEYHPERGLYYHFITEDVIVGSQPRSSQDIRQLASTERVSAILNMQADRDLHHWGVNIHELQHEAHQQSIAYFRTQAADFDPHSLRATLPSAVATLERARLQHGRVYLHCTAGLGRAPAVAIAALYWFTDMQLDEAYSYLTGIRPCGPNSDAVRGATYDLLSGRPWDGFHHEPDHAFATLSADDRAAIRVKLLGDS